MVTAGGGSIVHVSSISGRVGIPGIPQASYAAAKSGLSGLTTELAAQWSKDSVRVNTLAPGFFHSEITESLYDSDDGRRWLRRNTLLPYDAEADDLLGAVLWLTSDASRFVTGQTIVVDGGWTARLGGTPWSARSSTTSTSSSGAAVRQFLTREVVDRNDDFERAGIVDRDVFVAAGAAGFLGFAVPEEHGGGGVRDFRYNAVLGEEAAAPRPRQRGARAHAPHRHLPAVLPRPHHRRAEGSAGSRASPRASSSPPWP